jgi:hypothetical protein
MSAPLISAGDGLEEPLVEGVTRRFAVNLANPGPDPIALFDLRADGARDGSHVWRRAPFGSILYDAGRDAYVHFTDAAAVGAVAIETGIVPPGTNAEALLPLKSLAPGTRSVRVSVRWRAIPAAELASRLYQPPDAMEGRSTLYKLGRERPRVDPNTPPGRSILRSGDRPVEETTIAIDVTTNEDPASPGRVAAEQGRVVDRVRALGRAWIVERPSGGLVALTPGRTLELGSAIDARVLSFVDDLAPGETVPILLRGPRAAALEASLPVEGKGRGQQWFERESLGEVLEVLLGARAKVALGPHGVAEFGWIVE